MFTDLMDALGVNRVRINIDMIDRDLVRLLARRHLMVMRVGRIKAQRGMPVHIPEREVELLDIVREEAERHGLDPTEIEDVFDVILEQSREMQRRERARSWSRG